VIDMNETKLTTLEQVRMFLAGTAEIGFCVTGEGEDGRYRHIAGVLTRFGYKRLKKPDKGLILRYLERTTGYSRQQMTRLVNRWGNGKGLHKWGIRMSAVSGATGCEEFPHVETAARFSRCSAEQSDLSLIFRDLDLRPGRERGWDA